MLEPKNCDHIDIVQKCCFKKKILREVVSVKKKLGVCFTLKNPHNLTNNFQKVNIT